MTQTQTRSIVVAVDFSESSVLTLDRAFDIASGENPSEVHVVHIAHAPLRSYPTPFVFTAAESHEGLADFTRKALAAFRAKQRDGRQPARVVCHVRVEEPAHEIVQLASELGAELIVVGTHGRRGVGRVLLGSVAERVVRLAPCPVLVVRQKARVPLVAIEPPCPRCVETRRLTERREYWCDQHRERHAQRHTYHQGDRVSADSNFPLVFSQ